jgi:TM2 domain-containing membrane protein YozV
MPQPASPTGEKASPARFQVSVKQASETEIGNGRPRYRLLFAFLALFAGYMGAHNFYARQWLTGLLQLLLSLATFLMGFGIIAAWLWAMVEALLVRRDGHGIEMI